MLRLLQESFEAVSRNFHRCFKEVSRVLQGSLKCVSKSVKDVSRKIEECFERDSRVFQGNYQKF